MIEYQQVDQTTQNLSLLIYGSSGAGKTVLSAQSPKQPVLFLSCDPGTAGGLTSAVRFKPLQVKITSWSQFMQLLPQLEKDAGIKFNTLVLDSITYFQRIVMQSILTLTGREIARFEDWNLCVERLRNAINKLASFNCSLIMTATEQLIRDEITGKVQGLPNVPGKLAQELPAATDICIRLFTRTGFDQTGKKIVRYMFQSTPDEMWTGKDRTGLLPPEGLQDEFWRYLYGQTQTS